MSAKFVFRSLRPEGGRLFLQTSQYGEPDGASRKAQLHPNLAMPTNLSHLMDKIEHSFQDPSLLELALKHPSLDLGVHDNQRLEFLGDAVLGLVVAEALYRANPELEEGRLDRMRAGIVSGRALAPKAKGLGLDNWLMVSAAQRAHHPEPSKGMLEDALEAVIGAIYLDGGLEAARTSIEAIFAEELTGESTTESDGTPKSRLQEWTQKHYSGLKPEYALIGAEGPDHAKQFAAAVHLDGKEIGRGNGSSKKAAEIDAAANALKRLIDR